MSDRTPEEREPSRRQRGLGAFFTGSSDDEATQDADEPKGPTGPIGPVGGPAGPTTGPIGPVGATPAPLYPSEDQRPPVPARPVTRLVRPVTPPLTSTQPPPLLPTAEGDTAAAAGAANYPAGAGAVLVAGVDEHGRQHVLEDDPNAAPLVDPRYDENDANWVRYSTSWGGFFRVVLFVVLFIFLILSVRGRLYGWIDSQIDPAGEQGDAIEVVIPSGASTNGVATELEAQGVISNATVFRYWLRCDGDLSIVGFLGCETEHSFQAGSYELNQNMNFTDVVAVLEEGPAPEIFVDFTIPEGLRLEEIVQRLLEVNSQFDEAELRDALLSPDLVSDYYDPDAPEDRRLEGTLFPATYDVAEEFVADEARLLQRMADTFDARYAGLLDEVGRDPVIDELGLTDWDVIVIASLIEEEARVDVDRPLMARAIYNRLAQGTPLQIDASVYYAVDKSFTDTLFQSDLDTESPWNTYTTAGVPPSPIAAPGAAALRAALDPADGDYIFWARTDADGVVGAHTFSTTLAEHNEAVAVCRELGYCG